MKENLITVSIAVPAIALIALLSYWLDFWYWAFWPFTAIVGLAILWYIAAHLRGVRGITAHLRDAKESALGLFVVVALAFGVVALFALWEHFGPMLG